MSGRPRNRLVEMNLQFICFFLHNIYFALLLCIERCFTAIKFNLHFDNFKPPDERQKRKVPEEKSADTNLNPTPTRIIPTHMRLLSK